MAGGIVYLDIDDEITSAAARIRALEGSRAAVVLPHGSRVATSRINFRLLARDSQTNGKRLSVVAGDAATRALAASAGLPVYSSVSEYEDAIEDPRPDPPAAAAEDDGGGLSSSSTVVVPSGAADAVSAQPRAPAAGPDRPAAPARPRAPAPIPAARVVADTPQGPGPTRSVTATAVPGPLGRIRRPSIGRAPLIIVAGVTALVLVVGAVGAFVFLPTATAVIVPREETIGPITLRIVASTTASESEPDASPPVVPAETISLDVEASDSFPATGKRVEEARATGSVRFENLNPAGSNTIEKGSVVSAGPGIRFQTDARVTLPAAELVLGTPVTIIPSEAVVNVTAVDAGPEANVEANTITTVPRGESPVLLKVNNPEPMTGGAREEFPRVIQEDIDAAIAALGEALRAAFDDRLDEPGLAGETATTFPETAALGEPSFAVDPATLVGQEVETFDLAATASGTVVAVEPGPVRTVAERRIESSVEDGYALIDGSSRIVDAPAVIDGGVITFPVVVTARQVLVVDAAAIEAQIRGLTVADANEVLRTYGDVELTVWPDWVGTIPTFDARVEVSIRDDGERDEPDPSESPDASESSP